MILDIVKSVIGVLPLEYEFIYYIVSLGVSICIIAIPLAPILIILNRIFRRR
mgnify:CR=1 FL=1